MSVERVSIVGEDTHVGHEVEVGSHQWRGSSYSGITYMTGHCVGMGVGTKGCKNTGPAWRRGTARLSMRRQEAGHRQ